MRERFMKTPRQCSPGISLSFHTTHNLDLRRLGIQLSLLLRSVSQKSNSRKMYHQKIQMPRSAPWSNSGSLSYSQDVH